MSRVAVRLGVFTVLLAGTFGAAYAVGTAFPGGGSDDEQPEHPEHTEHNDLTEHTDDTSGAASVKVPFTVVIR